MFQPLPLQWERLADSRKGHPSWKAVDGAMRYRVFRGEGGWRVQLNGAMIGEKYKDPDGAMAYADRGGDPSRGDPREAELL
jgi:hypothetical protein